MNKFPKSCIYFPTTTLIIDDNIHFLESIVLGLKGMALTKISSDVDVALNCIEQNSILNIMEDGVFITSAHDYDQDDNVENNDLHVSIDINLKKIVSEIYNPDRYAHISNLLLDYSMPKINGIEFSKIIFKSNIIKTMLTGEADLNTAVSALNAELVNKFIQKGSPNLIDAIYLALIEMQKIYFEKISSPLLKVLVDTSASILKNDNFWEFLSKICEDHDIIEYYLMDKNGSFLLLNNDAEPLWLMIRTENDFNELVDVAIGNDAPQTILSEMLSRRKIPIIVSEADKQLSVKQWHDLMFDVKPFSNNSETYFTLIKDVHFGNIEFSKIKCFKEYLNMN